MTFLDPMTAPDPLAAEDPLAAIQDPLAGLGSLATPDPTSLDLKLASMRQVESRWELPALPDEVKLDLAAAGDFDEVGIGEFLFGIASDMRDSVASAAEPVTNTMSSLLTADTPGAMFQSEDDPRNTVRRLWAGWANQDPPEIVTADAVDVFNERARNRGLLTDAQLTGTWGPEKQQALYELLQEDKRSPGSARGRRRGARSWTRWTRCFRRRV